MAEEQVNPEAEELARLREEKAQWEAAERKRSEEAQAARIAQLEQEMKQQYRAVRQQNAPPPEQIYQAQQELGLTDEEILANPKESFEKMLDYRVNQALAQERQQMTQILGHQVRRGFDAEMHSLSSEAYYKDLQPVLQEYFEQNPAEAIVAGAVRRKYNELVGENLPYLTKLAAEREASRKLEAEHQEVEAAKASQNRVVEPQIRAGTTSRAERPKEGEFVLDENPARAQAKRDLMAKMNAALPKHLQLDEEEFVEIEEGRKFPKKMAADIQMGYGGPNVEY